MTWLRAPLACLVFALVLAPFTAMGAEPGACPTVSVNDDWTTVAAPTFPEAPAEITGYAVHPYLPDQILATNGKSMMATIDGGCSWAPLFALDLLAGLDIRVVAPAATIRSIVIPEHVPTKKDPTPIYLLIEERLAGAVSRPHVVVSRDAGETWVAAENGLAPLTGSIVKMRAAPSDPDILYLLMSAPGLGGGEMYATTDGGESWAKRGDVGASDFEIDPLVPDELWFSGPAGLRHSVDGGRSAADIPYLSPPVSVIDIFRARADEPSRIIGYEVEGGAISLSDDGGKTWRRFRGPPQIPLAMAHGNETDDVVISAHGGFHRFQSPHFWIEVSEDDGQGTNEEYEDILDLQVDRTDAPSVFGHTGTAIKRYTGFSIDLPAFISGEVPEKADAELTSSERKIRLEPGESRSVDLKLKLPPAPTPLDVYFLIDTTSSMDSSIRGLARGVHDISQVLALSKIDVRFGLGEYKDYPIAGYGDPVENDVPYRQNRDLGPADGELVAAIEALQASGGGRVHIPESQLTALYQSATGEGDPGFVEPGQEAGFRRDALKVLINITDAPFDNSPAHPSPPFDAVANELKGRGILQVGLAVYGPNGVDGASQWLTQMAEATDTVAPVGVDCDDDGIVDIERGAPLVCEINGEETTGVAALAPAILSSLKALTDSADVALVPTSGDLFVSSISPPVYPDVNVKVPNLLDFKLVVTCPRSGSDGGVIDLVTTVTQEVVAGTALEVVCGPVEPETVLPPREENPPVAVVPPALAPQPGIVPIPPPPAPPAPVTQTQVQPNPHVQGALAQQEQDQVQVALAASYDQLGEGEYAFSSYSRRSRGPGAAPILYMSALVMTAAAAGFALRRRVQPSFSRSGGVKGPGPK